MKDLLRSSLGRYCNKLEFAIIPGYSEHHVDAADGFQMPISNGQIRIVI
jgi:hypothetical protein